MFIVEGDKDADRLAKLGAVVTTNVGGAGKWRPEFAAHLRGRKIVALPDNDDTGRKHAQDVARSAHGKVTSVKLVELPGLQEHGDVSDSRVVYTRDDLLEFLDRQKENSVKPP